MLPYTLDNVVHLCSTGGGAGLLGNVIALEQFLVLGLEERITGTGLCKDEESHDEGEYGVWHSVWSTVRTKRPDLAGTNVFSGSRSSFFSEAQF